MLRGLVSLTRVQKLAFPPPLLPFQFTMPVVSIGDPSVPSVVVQKIGVVVPFALTHASALATFTPRATAKEVAIRGLNRELLCSSPPPQMFISLSIIHNFLLNDFYRVYL